MGTLLQDLRHGLRLMRRAPLVTALAVVALALGTGANTAIFSVVNAVLLRPLPYDQPDRLVVVYENNLAKGWDRFSVAAANYVDWSASGHFERMAAFERRGMNLTGGAEPERVAALRATSSLFGLLGLAPSAGRLFTEQEDRPGAPAVAVIGHALRARLFGDGAVVTGRTIVLDGVPHEVVGVLGEEFRLQEADLVVPMRWSAEQAGSRGSHRYLVLARLRPGDSVEQARTALSSLAALLERSHPETNRGWGVKVVPLHEEIVGDVRPMLLVLMGAVGFVLLIACANVASLLLARGSSRRGEFAVRAALGAGKGRLIRQVLTESALLGLAGGAGGLLAGIWGADLILAVAPRAIPRASEIVIDGRVLSFTLGISLLTGLLFGLAPALGAAGGPTSEALKLAGRTPALSDRHRLGAALVVGEIALSLVLLVGAGLLVRSFWKLQSVDPGFDPDGVLAVPLSLSPSRVAEPARWAAFYQSVLERAEALPGVTAASAITDLPVSGTDSIFAIFLEGVTEAGTAVVPSANYYAVDADYFHVMGIPLKRGRLLADGDRAGAPRVAVINETMARRLFGGTDPLGRRLRIGSSENPEREIVGIVGDTVHYGLGSEPTMQVYEPHLQEPSPVMTLAVRYTGRPAGLTDAIRRVIREIDPDQPVGNVRTLGAILSGSVAPRRLSMLLMTILGAIAMVLAAVGAYGVMALATASRTREFGVRLALGATQRDVLTLVLRQGLMLSLAGLAGGLAGSLALTRLMSRLLFGVGPLDPATLIVVSLLLAAVAVAACWLPARRAARVDPMVALRHE